MDLCNSCKYKNDSCTLEEDIKNDKYDFNNEYLFLDTIYTNNCCMYNKRSDINE